MRAAQRVANLALALLLVELLLVVLSSGTLSLGVGPVGAAGLALRLVLFGLLLVARVCAFARETRWNAGVLTLALLLLPALYEFHVAGGRLGGDGISYFVYTRSLVFDRDLDFTNEYEHFGLLQRGDLAMPTQTGLRRSIFAVGPGLLAIPFYLLGHGVALLQVALGQNVLLQGYAAADTNGAALAGLAYGFLALLLIHDLLRRHFAAPTALAATLLTWGATFLHWYMVQQPAMSHAYSTCAAVLVLWLWDRNRDQPTHRRTALLGLSLGFAMCVRWQNGLLLLLPAWDAAIWFWRGHTPAGPWSWVQQARLGALLALGVSLGALPQLWAWKTIYGEWLLLAPPHGVDFLRLSRPFLLETLFSSRHGLLAWTPILWAGYLGFVPLTRLYPRLALPLLLPVGLATYVNACSGDWWAGGSFSNRRFDALLPILALGLAAAWDALRETFGRRPRLALALVLLPILTFNVTLAEQLHRGLLPRDETVDFKTVVRGGAQVFTQAIGWPTTWPASWWFASRHDRPAGQFDLLVGRYLFYRQNNLGGVLPVGEPGDEPYLGEGFARRSSDGLEHSRRLRGRGRVFFGLDVPEDLDLYLRLGALGEPARVDVSVNGVPCASVWVDTRFEEARVPLAAGALGQNLNELSLEAPPDRVRVGQLRFVRRGAL